MDSKRALFVSLALFLPLLSAACSAEPYLVPAPGGVPWELDDNVPAIALREPDDAGTQPRTIAVCYNSMFSEPAEVVAQVQLACPGKGEIVRVEQDVFWNNCSLSDPARAIFTCMPGPAKPSEFK